MDITRNCIIALGGLWVRGGADILNLLPPILILVEEDQVKMHESAVSVPACVQKLYCLAKR